MAAVLTQDAVLRFIQSRGGSVKNSDLLIHFRGFIRDHADRERNRELFKKFVNSVATVRQEDGASVVVLRKQFRGGDVSANPAIASEPSSLTRAAEKRRPKPQLEPSGTPAPAGGAARGAALPAAGIVTSNNVEPKVKGKESDPPLLPGSSPAAPAPGPITAPLQEATVPERPAQDQGTGRGQKRAACGPLHGATPVTPAVRHHGETTPQAPEVPVPQTPKGREGRPQSEGGLTLDPEIVRFRYRQSYKAAMSCDEDEEEEELPVRPSSGGAVWPVSELLRDTARTFSTSSPGAIDPAPPSVLPPPFSSSKKQAPKIFIQDVEWEPLVSPGPESPYESGLEAVSASIRPSPPVDAQRHRPSPNPAPLQDVRSRPPAAGQAPVEPTQGLRQDQRLQLSPGLSGISPLTSDASFSSSDWPSSGWTSSHKDPLAKTAAETVPQIEDLIQRARGTAPGSSASPWQQSAAETGQVPQVQNLLQRAQGTKVEPVALASDSQLTASAWHHSTGSLHDNQPSAARALCLSTGDLLDDRDEVQSSDGSTSTPRLRQHLRQPSMLSYNARRRMCHSLGTDLDRIDQEDVRGSEAARLSRLHLISSSLSLRGNLSCSSLSSCSTPPRCLSLVELDERPEHNAGRTSLPVPNTSRATASSSSPSHQEAHAGHVRQALVPLESREHKWHVKAAAGAWPDIYSLLRDDSSLLNKQDFISGFSVLHWIAKHGDHRVLNTLWYGVQKLGLTFNVNARSFCGYTPLHIAAIHGSKNIMRLLIKNFGADVKLRDLAGKRPWQYLSGSMTPDIFQLLGAPARAALQDANLLDQPQQQLQQQRRRRHHLSTASSGERPSIVAGLPKVKRSSSLAAFLKHKSLLPFHGQQSGAVV